MKKLEVRCCCDAAKVLGHLTDPRLQKPGDRVVFMVLDNTQIPDHLFVPGVTRWSAMPMKELELTVDEVILYPGGDFGPRVCEPAIKNRDYPLRDLELIPGFEPLTWEPTDGQEG